MSRRPIGNTLADHHGARGHHVYPLGYGEFVCRCGHAWKYQWPGTIIELTRRRNDRDGD